MPSDILILGTDTDAGKTTFCLLFLQSFATEFAYWKPLASGTSDAETVSRFIPGLRVHPPVMSFAEPVAPLLAAMHEGKRIPTSEELAQSKPLTNNRLIIESFGSPFSPLNESELQIEFLRRLAIPSVLVSSSHLGAIGRTVQTFNALAGEGVVPEIIILVGEPDPFATQQIGQHTHRPIFSLLPPGEWSSAGIASATQSQKSTLLAIKAALTGQPPLQIRSASVVETDRTTVWHPYTPLVGADEPLVVESARDEFLFLADGRTIIDAISSWWTIQHGHRFPPLMNALHEASGKLDHVIFAGATHRPGVELAKCLLETTPWPDGRVFYSDNGSTAVEVALKMCYQYWCHQDQPERTLFIGFEDGYHGDTFGSMSVGRDPLFFGTFEPLLFRTLRIPVSARSLEETLSQHHREVAGVLLEPMVQGAGGMKMHTPETLREIVQMCRRFNIPFIADEVMTGGGRTGTRWAFEHAKIQPDLICAGKTIAGGILPIAATLVSPQLVQAFETKDRRKTFFHGHSFTAHPLACALGVANCQEMARGGWLHQVREMECFWFHCAEEWKQLPGVREVRIMGTIAALEIESRDGYLASVGVTMRRTAIHEGVLLRPLGNVLYAMPPFGTSAQSLERIHQTIVKAVRAVSMTSS